MNRTPDPTPPFSASSTFCATIVDEWSRNGVDAAFVAPGSRSTPLVVALLEHESIAVHLFHDERSASFAALGHSLATGKASVVACTSGTAGAHFHAAVLEASASGVPLIVCTADRPIELMDVAAPQTIDQIKLFGDAVRRFSQPEPAQLDQSHWWRSWASQLVADAAGWAGRPGPVHINLRFREPLLGKAAQLPEGRDDGGPWHQIPVTTATVDPADLERIADLVRSPSGLLICGRGTPNPEAVVALGDMLAWPVIADHRSGARHSHRTISHSDLLLRSRAFADAHQPDVVVRFGEIHTSKVLSQWLGRMNATVVSAVANQRWVDPERVANIVVAAPNLAESLLTMLPSDATPSGRSIALQQSWFRADRIASDVIQQTLAKTAQLSEPEIAREVLANAPAGSTLVLSSSMPVRDIEWFGQPRPDITVVSNRGANGIDGVISTAIGVALSHTPTTLLIGDVAFLHDSSALAALASRPIDLHIVVVDNDGGGIFSFLPQAAELSTESFETLFGTPHGTNFAALCAAHGIPTRYWHRNPKPATDNLDTVDAGVRVTIAATDREVNKAIHDELVDNIVDAIATDQSAATR